MESAAVAPSVSVVPSVEAAGVARSSGGGKSGNVLNSIKSIATSPMVIHMAVELVVIGGVSFYFHRRTKALETELADLKKKFAALETAQKEQAENVQMIFSVLQRQQQAATARPATASASTSSTSRPPPPSTPAPSPPPKPSAATSSTPATSSKKVSTPRRSATPTRAAAPKSSSVTFAGDALPTVTVVPQTPVAAPPTAIYVQASGVLASEPTTVFGRRSAAAAQDSSSESDSGVDSDELDASLQSEYERMERSRLPITPPQQSDESESEGGSDDETSLIDV